uniref:Toxin-antitoxin system, toxin component n=1 Tax=Enterobacter cloacae TaxID=550 RepID=A0A9X8XBR0_ENTCL|nr:toxin-antitoxin system, toxin component [Enterobacter cloacae]
MEHVYIKRHYLAIKDFSASCEGKIIVQLRRVQMHQCSQHHQ